MGRKKKIIPAIVSDEVDFFMKNFTKSSIAQLQGRYINHFVGETYEHSLKEGFEWISSKNSDKNNTGKIFVPVDYYPQVLGNKAVLLSYNVVDKLEGKSELPSILVD